MKEMGTGAMGNCFMCDRSLNTAYEIWTIDPQMQWVGPECYRKIKCGGIHGYQPALGGPRLFLTLEFANNYLDCQEDAHLY